MMRALLAGLAGSALLLACRRDPAPPPSAPLAIEVPPLPPSSSSGAIPPPNPEPFVKREELPAPSAEEPPPPPTPTAMMAPPPPVPPGQQGTQPFNRGAAAYALTNAPIQRCAVAGGPTGPGHVTVTWDPSGRVSSATLDQGPLRGTAVGGCLVRVYSTATVPPFMGAPVRVGKSFVLQ